ncbi:hypothetical protein VZT92_005690 [Zoarces viviparus]|uniref:Secreted protein n=1 Tax=Zoarces viviparus TaxID=48416 RepID=A0AAW1FUB2_ZOAVI
MSSSVWGHQLLVVRVLVKVGVCEMLCSRVKHSLTCLRACGLSFSLCSPLIHLTDSGRNSSLPERSSRALSSQQEALPAMCGGLVRWTPHRHWADLYVDLN